MLLYLKFNPTVSTRRMNVKLVWNAYSSVGRDCEGGDVGLIMSGLHLHNETLKGTSGEIFCMQHSCFMVIILQR